MSLSSLVIPHDGSPLAGAAVAAVQPLVHPKMKVTLLCVEAGPAANEQAFADAESKLAGCAAIERRSVASNDPAGAIVDAIAELRPDLVAMSTHGRTGVQRLVRGSVAERVLRSSTAPVLLVNPFTHPGSTYGSVLVPLDASDTSNTSAQILDTLVPLARALRAKLTLFHVDVADPTETPTMAAHRRATRETDLKEWLAAPRKRIEDAGLAVEIRIAFGNSVEEILRAADSGEFDMIAMTTHGRSGPSRWLLGSVAESVLRECRIPTLVRPTRTS